MKALVEILAYMITHAIGFEVAFDKIERITISDVSIASGEVTIA